MWLNKFSFCFLRSAESWWRNSKNLQNCQIQTISWDFTLSLQTNHNAMRYLHADYSHETIGKQVDKDQLDSNETHQEHFYLHSTKLNKY